MVSSIHPFETRLQGSPAARWDAKCMLVQACPVYKWLKGGANALEQPSPRVMITQDSPESWDTTVSGWGLTKGLPRLTLVSPRYWCGDFSQCYVFAFYPEHSEMFLSVPQNLFLESPLPCKLGEYITGLRCPRVPRTSLARGQTGHSGALSQEVALLLARIGCGSHL